MTQRVAFAFLAWLAGAVAWMITALIFLAPLHRAWKASWAWALLMSSATVVPAAATFGSAAGPWRRLVFEMQSSDPVERAIASIAYGSVAGCWLGAFPMPLNWGAWWQAWPITCTAGAIAGICLGGLQTAVALRVAYKASRA